MLGLRGGPEGAAPVGVGAAPGCGAGGLSLVVVGIDWVGVAAAAPGRAWG